MTSVVRGIYARLRRAFRHVIKPAFPGPYTSLFVLLSVIIELRRVVNIILEITITAKIKIKPTAKQVEQLRQTINAYRRGCNFVSEYIFKTKQLKQHKLHEVTYYPLRETLSLKAQMAQSVLKTVIARYKTNRSNGHDWSIVRFKKPEYDLVWNRDYSIVKGLFSLNTLSGRIKVPFETKGMESNFDGTWTSKKSLHLCILGFLSITSNA